MTVEVVTAGARLQVDPAAGGRATSFVVGGVELLGCGDGADGQTLVGWGMYPMAPWPGRLRDNTLTFQGDAHRMPAGASGWALHGTVLAQPWQVERVAADAVVLVTDLGPPWPWSGQVRLGWTLRPGELETTLEVTSAREQFPAAVGWHPWFRRRLDEGGPVRVELPGDSMLERGADHLPTGRLRTPRPPGPYDDTFGLPDGWAALVWPGAMRIECRTDCPYVVLFDEHEGAVCLEPQTAPPNGVNTDPRLVAPGTPLLARSTWSWAPDTR